VRPRDKTLGLYTKKIWEIGKNRGNLLTGSIAPALQLGAPSWRDISAPLAPFEDKGGGDFHLILG